MLQSSRAWQIRCSTHCAYQALVQNLYPLTTAVDESRKKSGGVQDNALSSIHQRIWYILYTFLRMTMDHQVRCAKHGRFYIHIVDSTNIRIMVHKNEYCCFVYANHTTQRGPPATSQPTHVLGRPLKKTTKELLQNDACSRCGKNLERRPVLLASFAVAGVALMFVTVTLQLFQNKLSFNIWAGLWAGLQPFAYTKSRIDLIGVYRG